MLKMGVIVPTKVERSVLQNAASIASLLLTTDAVISEIKARASRCTRWWRRDILRRT